MGLDMYAYFVKKENVVNDEEFNFVYGQKKTKKKKKKSVCINYII